MGVEGAAIATVISQIATFILNIIYIKKFKSIKISKESFKNKSKYSKKCCNVRNKQFYYTNEHSICNGI